ncbi:succinic semialdehyde dehydrogenase [Halosegnis marinus]|uniref:Succinic semialdehyde dehydrogenase n=1 Tax=Halosegnis marinus TaxID=3034023 RepID=A0ABD5ZRC7_9EURY|nr:succinic semialdehyde dehydrogenase [Halosegnis sp. DT85]
MSRFDPADLRSEATLADRDHETMTVEAPFTGDEFATLPLGDERDVETAFDAAREAQGAWEARDPAERADILLEFHDLLFEESGPLLDLMVEESGKARRHGYEELLDAALCARHYAYRAEGYLADESRKSPMPGLVDVEVNYRAKGVVGVISPWNYPLTLAVSDAVAALLAGNTVVLKPAEQTTYTALAALRLLREAGLPRDVFHVVPGTGPDVGESLVANSDYLCFTGSGATGSIVAAQAGEHLIDCSLELGGKNPAVVFPDADLDKAVRGLIRGCFTNAGQLCIAVERLYVHEDVRAEFTEKFVAAAERLDARAGDDWGVEMGSLVSADQLEKVSSHVEDARDAGAEVLTGGEALPEVGPYFYAPTVLTDVTGEADLHDQETFGPVVSVYGFEDTDEVVARANDSEYGLNASVWSGDAERGREVARRIDCGTANVNEAYAPAFIAHDAPMGGMGDSGVGRRHGPDGFYRFTEPQTLATQERGEIDAPPGVPYKWYAAAMKRLLKAVRDVPGIR